MAENEDALRRIVREEAERMRVRSALADETAPKPPPEARKSALRRLAEHPVGRLLVGFILTGVIGQWLSWTYAERKEEEVLRRNALEAVRDFSTLEQRRRARYVSVREAILNNASNEIVASRKADYDDAFVEWRAQLQAQRLRFREFFGFARRHPVEVAIDIDFLPIWNTLHQCLTEATLHISRDERPRALSKLSDCGKPSGENTTRHGSRFLLSVAKNCTYELSSSLNQHIMNGYDCGEPFWRDDGVRMYAALSDICDPVRVSQKAPDADAVWRYKTPRERAAKRWPYAITPAERKAATGEESERIARLDRIYDALCVKDDPWHELTDDGPKTSDPAFSTD